MAESVSVCTNCSPSATVVRDQPAVLQLQLVKSTPPQTPQQQHQRKNVLLFTQLSSPTELHTSPSGDHPRQAASSRSESCQADIIRTKSNGAANCLVLDSITASAANSNTDLVTVTDTIDQLSNGELPTHPTGPRPQLIATVEAFTVPSTMSQTGINEPSPTRDELEDELTEVEQVVNYSTNRPSSRFSSSDHPSLTSPPFTTTTSTATTGCPTITSSSTSRPQTINRPTLFHAVVRMMALAEGGIISQTDPEFGFAVNDAYYGILINRKYRLVYTREYGLQLVEFIE